MPTVISKQFGASQVRAEDSSGRGASAASKEGALLEEFSQLLDKISVQLENSHGFENFSPTAPRSKPVEKPEAVKEVKEGSSQSQQQKEEKGSAEQVVEGKSEQPKESQDEKGVNEAVDNASAEDTKQAAEDTEGTQSQDSSNEAAQEKEVEKEGAEQPEAEEEGQQEVQAPVANLPEVVPTEEIIAVKEAAAEAGASTSEVPVQESTDSVKVAAQALAEAQKKPVEQKQPEVVQGEAKPVEPSPQPQAQQPTAAPAKPTEDVLFQQPQKEQQPAPVEPSFQVEQPKEVKVAVKEFTDAVQRVAVAQQEAPKPNENSELAKIFHSLIQEKVAPAPTQHLSQDRFAGGGRSEFSHHLLSGSALKSVSDLAFGKLGEQVSSVASSGQSQHGNHNGHHALENRARSTESRMDQEPLKELSKGQELRTMKKVEEALKEVARSRDGKTISLRLDPPSLGNVRVDVSIRDGILHARLAADNSNVNNLLREKGQELQQMLRALGLEVDSVTVSVRDDRGAADHNTGQASDEQNFEREFGDETSRSSSSPRASSVGMTRQNSPMMDHWVA